MTNAQELQTREKQRTSEETYGSAEYWKHAKLDIQYERDINDLEWIGKQRSYKSSYDPNYKEAEQIYLWQREDIEKREMSTLQREERHRTRDLILSHIKTRDLVSARAAFVELFITMLLKADRKDQSVIVKDLGRTYGIRDLGKSKEVWNVISGSWMDKTVMKAAHIFPLSLGQETMTYIFGKDAKGELNSARNALWLPNPFEVQFDQHRVVMVPAGPIGSNPRTWKVVVVDGGIRNSKAYDGVTFGEINGKKLVFTTDDQPRARYLYFHYLCAMLRRSRLKQNKGQPMHTSPDVTMPELSRVWGSEGSYLRENIIQGFIEALAHEIPDDAVQRIRSHTSEGIASDEGERWVDALEYMELETDDEYDSEDER